MYRLDSGAGSLNCTVPGHTEFVETVEAMSSRGSCPVSDGIRDQAYLSIIALIALYCNGLFVNITFIQCLFFKYKNTCAVPSALLYLTLCNPIDCSPPGSSVREISQARILEWVAISFSRAFSCPSN